MGLISRVKRSIKASANAATGKLIDPEKELDMAIVELEETRKKALEELISYKAAAKDMDRQIAEEETRAADWEKKAMAAVKAGKDELAKKALREHKSSLAEIERIRRDRDEAASYAIQLNKSRKVAETKLQMLKLRKGTIATQLKVARSGQSSALGVDSELFEKFAEAEAAIDEDAIEAEVMAAMEGEDSDLGERLSAAEFDQKLLQAGGDPHAPAKGDPLAELKARMAAADAAKKAKDQ